MAKKRDRISTDGGPQSLEQNPFGALDLGDLKPASAPLPAAASESAPTSRRKRERKTPFPLIKIQRQKAGRGGKTVTVCMGFLGIDPGGIDALARDLRKSCGVGGTIRGKDVELQGDCRDAAKSWLEAKGFPVKFAGG